MSIIPVICHNFLKNCSKRRNQSSSTNISSNNSSNNKKFYSSDKIVSLSDSYFISQNSFDSYNNNRGGSCL